MTLSLADPIVQPALSPDLERRAAALARWRKRSEQVHFFRRALPAAIAAILIFGVGWVVARAVIAAFSQADRDTGTIHLINPVFYGRTSRGEPYVMSASEAVRDGADPDRIALTEPDLKQYVGAPQPQTAHALHGLYREQEKLLDMMGHVVATDGHGNVFRSEFAHVDMQRNSVVGNVHSFSEGPSGTIQSDAYQSYDKGQHVIFTGHVKSHLITAHKQGPGQPAAAKPALTPAAVPPMQASVITPSPR
jgi:lipopolysaccharide export system protein LptC